MPTKNQDRTALLIHCSQEEADRIREAAIRERRTISGFVLNAVISRFEVESRVAARREEHRRSAADERAAIFPTPANPHRPER